MFSRESLDETDFAWWKVFGFSLLVSLNWITLSHSQLFGFWVSGWTKLEFYVIEIFWASYCSSLSAQRIKLASKQIKERKIMDFLLIPFPLFSRTDQRRAEKKFISLVSLLRSLEPRKEINIIVMRRFPLLEHCLFVHEISFFFQFKTFSFDLDRHEIWLACKQNEATLFVTFICWPFMVFSQLDFLLFFRAGIAILQESEGFCSFSWKFPTISSAFYYWALFTLCERGITHIWKYFD